MIFAQRESEDQMTRIPDSILPSRICPVCGKSFQVPYKEIWGWQIRSKGRNYVCCSYSCMREIERSVEANKKKRGRKKQNDL